MPSPVFTACSMQNEFTTGSIPGMPASIKLTFEFGSAPNWVDALENSFDFDLT